MTTLKFMFFFVLYAIGAGTSLMAIMLTPMPVSFTMKIVIWAAGTVGTANMFYMLGHSDGTFKEREKHVQDH